MGRHKTITDDALVEEARAVFLEQGIAGSTKEIARRAGVSEATLFRRFPTKRELLIAALAPGHLDPETVLKPDTAPKDPHAALAQFGSRMCDYFRTQIPRGLLLMTSGIPAEEFMSQPEHSPVFVFTLYLAGFIRDWANRGEVSAANPMAQAGLYVAAIHSLVIFELTGGHSEDHSNHALESFTAALWSGLTPRKR